MPSSLVPVGPPPRKKWLNIVFDLNGVLCEVTPRNFTDRKLRPYKVGDNVLCHRNPTIIGPKAVFARQNVSEFLREVFQIADRVLVWTAMLKSNAEPIAAHIFSQCRPPHAVMCQTECKMIEVSRGNFFCMGPKVVFLKVLSDTLFGNPGERSSFNADNTLLIDDSPEKSICNEKGNALVLDTWTHEMRRNDTLMGELLPWLRGLTSDCQPGHLRDYVQANRIGSRPLLAGDHRFELLVGAMRQSAQNVGARFDVPAENLVIGRCRRRS